MNLGSLFRNSGEGLGRGFFVFPSTPCSAGFAIQLLWNIRICNPIE